MDAVTKDPFNYLESSLKFTCFTSDFELKCALSLNVILVIGFAFFSEQRSCHVEWTGGRDWGVT